MCYVGAGLEPVSWNSRVLVDSLLPDGINEQKLGAAGAAVFTGRLRTNDPCRCLGCLLASLLRPACCWWCFSDFQLLDLCSLHITSLDFPYRVLAASVLSHFVQQETVEKVSGNFRWKDLETNLKSPRLSGVAHSRGPSVLRSVKRRHPAVR